MQFQHILNNIIDPYSGLFVIGAWVDTKEKEDLLKDCIQRCRESFSSEILLVTHLPVSTEIQNLVDYYIYDKKNPLLLREEYKKYNQSFNIFYDNLDFRISSQMPFRHDYAVWTSFQNAFNFAHYLKKENIYYIEFDIKIDPVEFKNNFILPLDNCKACLKDYNNISQSGLCCATLFSIKTKEAIKCINNISSKEDFYRAPDELFEKKFHGEILKVIDSKDCFYIKNEESENFFSGSSSIVDFSSVFLFCKDEENYCYLFIDMRKYNEGDNIEIEYNNYKEIFSVNRIDYFILLGLDYENKLKKKIDIKDKRKKVFEIDKEYIDKDCEFNFVFFKKDRCKPEDRRGYFKNKNSISENNIVTNTDSGIFIIGTWADTIEKEDLLKNCIYRCKESYSSEILLVTHLPVSTEIQNLVDYYIYDKKNPLLFRSECNGDESDIIHYRWYDRWYENYFCKVTKPMPFKHDYAIWTSFQNAFNFADYLKKENIYYVEFDIKFNPVEFKNNFILPLNQYKACLKEWDKNKIDNAYCTNIFSIKTKEAIKCVNSIVSKKQLYDVIQNRILEQAMPEILFKYITQNEFFKIENKEGESSGRSSLLHAFFIPGSIFNGDIFFCQDEEHYCYLFLDLRNQPEIELFINYMERNEKVIINKASGFGVFGLDFEDKVEGWITVEECKNIIYKKYKDNIIEESRCNTISFKESQDINKIRSILI